jgi:GDP-L-fucose synthase
MRTDAKVFVAGHRGLAGSAILRELERQGCRRTLLRTHVELDLGDPAAVEDLFRSERPEVVFLAAAKVGGILANSRFPADFIEQNLAIQNNVIRSARRFGVARLLFLGSSCIYPRDAPQPLKEEYLLTGPLEATNRPYAIAKIAGIEMCWAFNRQHGTKYLCAMPTNLFGPGDNYDPENSHVLPALIRRMHEAKASGAERVVVWGTGTPRREFLYSDDLARACVFLAGLSDAEFDKLLAADGPPLINIGTGTDLPIRELAALVARCTEFAGRIEFDASKPDGTPRKLLDVSKIASLGWRATIPLEDGIRMAYGCFLRESGLAVA